MKDISVMMILKVVAKRLWIILLAAIIVGVGAFVYYGNFVDSVYSASSSVIASNGGVISDDQSSLTTSGKLSNTDIAASINILETCIDIMKTHNFYEHVAKQPLLHRMDYSASDLKRMVDIERRSDYSLFIDIKVTCADSNEAIAIANCIADTAPDYIQKMIADTYVVPADRSVVASLVAPLTLRNAVIAAMLAAVIVVAVFVILAATDDSIKGEEDIIKKYNVAVLGVVPDFEPTPKKGAKK